MRVNVCVGFNRTRSHGISLARLDSEDVDTRIALSLAGVGVYVDRQRSRKYSAYAPTLEINKTSINRAYIDRL